MSNFHNIQLNLLHSSKVEKVQNALQQHGLHDTQASFAAAIKDIDDKRNTVTEAEEAHDSKHSREDGGKEERDEANKRNRDNELNELARKHAAEELNQGKSINIEV